MDKETQNHINKDLILRERLAIERTDMAIDRTFLSFLRTTLYFVVAGMTVNSLLKASYGRWVEIVFWIIAGLVLIIGLVNFFRQKKKLKNNKIHIGNYKLEWEED